MCTNYVLTRGNPIADLATSLGVDADLFRYGDDMGPGSTISLVVQRAGERQVRDAIWWLYLAQTPEGLKPDKRYFSVNTNHAKLDQRLEYRHQRCIVPASAIVESQDGKRPHLLEPADGSAFALGGLWKEWTDRATGEIRFSASVITLPGHPALADIHRKSVPLWLPAEAYDAWLDEQVTDTRPFADLLSPTLPSDLLATPIDKARSKNPVGEPFNIPRGG